MKTAAKQGHNVRLMSYVKTVIHSLLQVRLWVLLVLVFGGVFYTRAGVPTRVYAAPSSNLNFQARLSSSSGNVVPDGNYSIEFKIYSVPGGGTAEWSETQPSVRVVNGYMTVQLGSVASFPGTIDWSQEHWLTMNVNGDGEMNPRLKLTAVPYAFRSGQADTLTNGSSSLTSDNLAQLAPSSVQVVNTALAALRLNQTGAGLLAQFQGNGSDVFTIGKTGDVVSSGSATFNGGVLTVGGASQAGTLILNGGNGNTLTLQTGSQSGSLTFTMPTGYGSNGDCLKGNGNGVLSFNACAGANSFVNGGNSFGSMATLGTTDSNSLQLITGGSQAMLIDTSGGIRIGSTGSPSEKLDVDGAIRIGSTASANAGTIRWTGSDFEGYNGSQWISFTTGAGNANASANFVSGLANVGANVTGAAVETMLFTTATAVSNTAGVTGFTAPAAGSFRTCLVKNTANITGGTLNLRWRVNGVSVGSGACTMNSTSNRQKSTVLNANVVTFAAGDTIGIAFDTVGLSPTTNDFTVYWSVEYNSSAASSSATLQDAYNNSTAPATITTASGKDLKVELTDMATDASLLVDIATGSSGRFAVQDNGTDILAVMSTGITLSKLVTATAGLDLASSGITNAGSITGIGANLTGAGALTVSSTSSGDLTFNSASGLVILGASTLRTADNLILDIQKATDTVLTLQNSGGGISNLNLSDGGLQTNGTIRLTNGGALQNITGLTVTSGGASIAGNITLGGASTDRITFTGQVLGASPLVFQGVTDNSFTTTLAVTDPTANNIITLPNASGTLVLDSRTIGTGTGLSGGGDLSTNRTLSLDINGLTSTNVVNQSDYVAVYDGTGIKKISRSNFLQGIIGALQYQGTWDASTNTPTLADNTGSNGDMYAVSVAGTRNLGSGNLTFAHGDFVIHNGTKWEIAPSATGVNTVFGRSNDVTAQNGDYTASQVTNVAAGNISSVTVQAALNELDAEKLSSLNGLTTISQSFANDTNVTITSSGSTHTLGWSGQLSVARGGTGAGSFTTNGVLYGNNTGSLQVTSAGTGGQLLVANSSGVPTFTTLSGDATLSDTGVLTIGADKVALSTDTTGSYVANLGALTGLSTTGNSGEGSTPTLSVIYGNGANTAVQGNTTLICPSGTGNLSGTGNTITLGTGGTCNSLDTQAAVTFSTSVTTPIITSGGGLNISSAASGDITFNSGTNKLVIDGSDVMLQRTGSGAFAIDLNDVSTTSLILENTGAGVANLNLFDGGLQIAGTTVLTNGLVLQNVTADTGILTSGLLPVSRGGTGAGTFTANGIIYGNGTGALQVTGAGLTNQCLIATTGGAPSWGSCTGGAGVATLQQTYDSGSTVITTDNRGLSFTLADTATDSDFLIDIATGSTSKFAIQSNSTDILSVTSTGTIISSGGLTILAGGASITGGINNNTGGITNAGSISGVTTLSASGTITASGNITTNGSLVEKSVTFTPTTPGWYRIVSSGGAMAGGVIRINAPIYDNTLTDVEFQYSISGYGLGGSIQQTRFSSYNNGVVYQARISSDSVNNVYLDIYISTANSPQPITIYGFGPSQPNFVASPVVGAVAGGSSINTLTLGQGFRSTQGAVFAEAAGNVGIGTAAPTAKLQVVGSSNFQGDIGSSGLSGLQSQANNFNLAPNSSFEVKTSTSGVYPDGWSGGDSAGNGSATTTLDFDSQSDGRYAMKSVTTGTNSYSYIQMNSYIPVKPSAAYVSSIDARHDTTANNCSVGFISRVHWYTSTLAAASTPYTDVIGYGPTTTSWATYSGTATTPSDASFAQLIYYNFVNTGDCTRWYDNVVFRSVGFTGDVVFGLGGGNVGIGTTGTPSALFSVGGTTGNLTIDSSGNLATGGTVRLSVGGALQNITGISTSGSLVFNSFSGSAGLLKVDGSGNVAVTIAGTDYEVPLSFNNGLTRTSNSVTLGGALTSATNIALGGNNLTFTGTGNIGIGAASPATMLELQNSSAPALRIGLASSTTSGTIGGLEFRNGSDSFMAKIEAYNPAGIYNDQVGLRFYTTYQSMFEAARLTPLGSLVIGTHSEAAYLDVRGLADTADTTSLLLRSGNSNTSISSTQIAFGYNNTATYRHSIKTRHNSNAQSGNALDFYLWNQGTDAAGAIGTKHVMTLDGTGNVGIGTSNPGALLSVGATNQFQVSSTGFITGVGLTSAGALINLNNNSNFATNINSGTSTGTVTIGGGTAPLVINSTAFDVSSTGALSGITTIGLSGAITGATATNTINGLIINAGALSGITTLTASGRINSTVGFAHNNVNGATVSCGSNNFLGTQVVRGGIIISGTCENDDSGLSDVRLKTNVAEVGSVLDKLKSINVVDYNFKCDDPALESLRLGCELQTGVIAQELAQVFPELVSQGPDGYYRVRQRSLTFYNLKAVGELAAIISANGNAKLNDVSTGGILRLNQAGLLDNINGLRIVNGGASITGGLNNNEGGITNTGAILGATTINAESLSLNANSIDNLLTLRKDNAGVFTIFNNGALEMRVSADDAFALRDASGKDYFNVNTNGGLVRIGSAVSDEIAVLFVLDSKSTAGDPQGVNGAQYYNEATHKFRCYQNNQWQDCLPASNSEYVLVAQPQSWNHPLADTEFLGQPRTWVELTNAREFRLTTRLTAGGSAAADCRLQYAISDNGPWKNLDGQDGPELSLANTGSLKTPWATIDPEARKEVLIRVMCKEGSTGVRPEFYGIKMQVR